MTQQIDRWNTPPEMTAEMRAAAYRTYVEATLKGYVAFQDIVDCFRAAFEVKRRADGEAADGMKR